MALQGEPHVSIRHSGQRPDQGTSQSLLSDYGVIVFSVNTFRLQTAGLRGPESCACSTHHIRRPGCREHCPLPILGTLPPTRPHSGDFRIACSPQTSTKRPQLLSVLGWRWGRGRGGRMCAQPTQPPRSRVSTSLGQGAVGSGKAKGKLSNVLRVQRFDSRGLCRGWGLAPGARTVKTAPCDVLPWSGTWVGVLRVEDHHPLWAQQTAEQQVWEGAAHPYLGSSLLRVPSLSQKSPA